MQDGGFYTEIISISKSKCLEMINTKKNTYPTTSGYTLIELKSNSKVTHSVTSVGSISSDGSCEHVENFKSNGRTYL